MDTNKARALSAPALQPPSLEYPFGTDRQGRDLLATMVAGTPLPPDEMVKAFIEPAALSGTGESHGR